MPLKVVAAAKLDITVLYSADTIGTVLKKQIQFMTRNKFHTMRVEEH